MFKKTALAVVLSVTMLVSGCAVQQERGGKEEVVQQTYDDFIKNPPEFVVPQTKIKEVNDLFTAIVKMSELQYQSLLELDSVTRNNMAGYSVYVTTKRMEADAYKEWQEKNNPKPADEVKDQEDKPAKAGLSGFFGQIKANFERSQVARERMTAERDAFQESLKGKSAAERNRMLLERQKLEEALRTAPGIVHNRLKIHAAVTNARIFREIQNEYGSFDAYLTHWTGDAVIHETGKVSSPLSDAVSADLKKRGMKFAGTVIIYSYLQAVGRIESHEDGCFLGYKM